MLYADEDRKIQEQEPRSRSPQREQKQEYLEVCVGAELKRREDYGALKERLQDIHIKMVEAYSQKVKAYVSDKVNQKSQEMRMKGLHHFSFKVLHLIKNPAHLLDLETPAPHLRDYLVRPLKGLTFYLDRHSMDKEITHEITGIVEAYHGEVAKEREEADYVVVDAKKEFKESSRSISYQAVYHLVGAFGVLKNPTLSPDFTKSYFE